MFRILVPVDGSDTANRAVDHLLKQLSRYNDTVDVHLLNVQPSLHGNVTMFVNADQCRQFHRDEGIKALAAARTLLDAVKAPYQFHIGVGDPAHLIVQYATEKKCDQIFMGSRGLDGIAGLLLGSVTMKVIHLTDIPVLLVK